MAFSLPTFAKTKKVMQPGEINYLRLVRFTDNGAYLEDRDAEEVLLPNKFVLPEMEEDDEVAVFVYTDSEDRIVATTQTPHLLKGEIACLQIKEVSAVGAFADWGLDKDLLIPFKEQRVPVMAGNWYNVYLALDEQTGRLYGSTKLRRYINNNELTVAEGDTVEVLIDNKTELGVNAIINQKHFGLIFKNQIFKTVKLGEKHTAYVDKIGENNKIDLTLQQTGKQGIDDSAQQIIQALKANQGSLPLNDKSDPKEISNALNMSKKAFKRGVGQLYREQLIDISDSGITLLEAD